MIKGQFATPVLLSAGAVLVSGVTGLAFAGWLDNGARIFMAMAETGLAWCF
ncbi:hypothetical protein [Aliihoeflea sp. PC F10.4]